MKNCKKINSHSDICSYTIVIIKIAVFWDVTVLFDGQVSMLQRNMLLTYPKYAGSTFLQITGTDLPGYAVLHPKRQ